MIHLAGNGLNNRQVAYFQLYIYSFNPQFLIVQNTPDNGV